MKLTKCFPKPKVAGSNPTGRCCVSHCAWRTCITLFPYCSPSTWFRTSLNWLWIGFVISNRVLATEKPIHLLYYFSFSIHNSPFEILFVIYYTNRDPTRRAFSKKMSVGRRSLFVSRMSPVYPFVIAKKHSDCGNLHIKIKKTQTPSWARSKDLRW
jgi:hypothetical protein